MSYVFMTYVLGGLQQAFSPSLSTAAAALRRSVSCRESRLESTRDSTKKKRKIKTICSNIYKLLI